MPQLGGQRAPDSQGRDSENWCIVRRRGWWRNKEKQSKTPIRLATTGKGRGKFFEKAFGRCFNYLDRDHKRAHCRDPVKCWKCKGSGHTSSLCKAPPSTGRLRPPHHTQLQGSLSFQPFSPHKCLHSLPNCVDLAASCRQESGGLSSMERRLSFSNPVPHPLGTPGARPRRQPDGPWGSAVNYPGNPRFRPLHAFKIAYTTDDMEERRQMLSDLALLITEEGPLGVLLRDEVRISCSIVLESISMKFMCIGPIRSRS